MEKSQVFGGRCCELLATFDQESSSWKMLQISFNWAESMSLDLLPKSGMTVNGRLYQLSNLERHILDGDGFVLDMPPQCLTRDGVLPTPTATGTDHRHRYSQGGRPLLHMLTKGLPTPTAHDCKDNPSTPSSWTRKTSMSVEIAKMEGYTKETIIGKELRIHPHFVEWMMGFPIGWLD